jgi:hypothetical protein
MDTKSAALLPLLLLLLLLLRTCCQAIVTAADLAKIHNSKVTVLVVDQPGAEGDPTVKLQVINKVRPCICLLSCLFVTWGSAMLLVGLLSKQQGIHKGQQDRGQWLWLGHRCQCHRHCCCYCAAEPAGGWV